MLCLGVFRKTLIQPLCVCVCVCVCVQVGGLSQECSELRLRVDTLTKTLKTCELDSKASRLHTKSISITDVRT